MFDGRLGQLQRFVGRGDFASHRFSGVGERCPLGLQRFRALVDFRKLAVRTLTIDLETAQLIATFAREPIRLLHAGAHLRHQTARSFFLGRATRELLGGLPHFVIELRVFGDGPLAIGVHALA